MNKKIFWLLILAAGLLNINLFAKSYEPDFNVQDFIENTKDVNISLSGKTYILEPLNSDSYSGKTAMIFYPGGKVSYEAYLPLLVEIARKGILCIMPQMHHDLAIYNIYIADRIIKDEAFCNVENWIIGGHSLGGAMACVWAYSNPQKIKALVLLAAFSTKNISSADFKVLSLYGSNDGVLNRKSYEKYRKNLPAGFEEYVIQGGNHCCFGNYGFQKGDNPADISSQEQKILTAGFIAEKILPLTCD